MEKENKGERENKEANKQNLKILKNVNSLRTRHSNFSGESHK